jgi:hypothetical protein
MVVDERRRFWVAEDPSRPKDAAGPPRTVVYDVELLAIDPAAATK